MSPIKSFEDLLIWQMARELVRLIYASSNSWRDLSLQDQIRRAAVSVMSNIAEGFERGTKDEFLHFLYIARGSCGEVRTQTYIALDQQFITKAQFEKLSDQADHLSRLIYRFIESYRRKSYGGQRYAHQGEKKNLEFDQYLEKIMDKKVTR